MKPGDLVKYKDGLFYWSVVRVLLNGRLVIRCVITGKTLTVRPESVTRV